MLLCHNAGRERKDIAELQLAAATSRRKVKAGEKTKIRGKINGGRGTRRPSSSTNPPLPSSPCIAGTTPTPLVARYRSTPSMELAIALLCYARKNQRKMLAGHNPAATVDCRRRPPKVVVAVASSRKGNPKLTAGKLHRNAQASTPPGTSLLHGGCSCRYCLPRRY
nr:hypothetical protein Iba_chr01dCG2170 [Ipomoea batatas]